MPNKSAILSPRKIILFVLCLGFVLAALFAVGFGYYLVRPAEKGGKEQVFLVQEGATLRSVTAEMETRALIKSRRLFLLWARFKGAGRDIKAGEYRLSPAMPPLKILETLTKGWVITYAVTIPEGFTRYQIAELLAGKKLVKKDAFLSLTADPETARAYGIAGPDLEGYLYPDTYHFSRGLSAREIVGVLVKRFQVVFEPLRERVKALNMTPGQVVTLASIVEKETGLARERPIIASVFLNRLKKRMRLESDPTVIYGLKNFDGNLTRKDLSSATPYNTYKIRGLPPGPIANPGEASLRAVLYPEDTDYLYFVSKNDGSHHFSKTLREHNRAVRIYQKQRRRKTS